MRFAPPPRLRTVVRPYVLRPLVRRLGASRLFSGALRVISSGVTYVRYRRAGEVGLTVRIPMAAQAPSISSILWPGRSVTIAFFQSRRRPWKRPIRLSFPSNDAVRTDATLTLKTVSTAARISTLLASGRTRNATVFCSSFWRMLFSVMSGRIRITRAARVIVTGSARPAWTEGGLRGARAGSDTPGLPSQRSGIGFVVAASAKRSFREGLLERQQAGALEEDATSLQELIDGHVSGRLDGQPRHVARRPRHGLGQLAHDQERRLAGEPEGTQPGDQRFRLSVGDVDRLDRRELAGRNLGRDRGAQRSAAHRARQVLVVAPGRRPKRLAATLPLDRPGRALPSPAGPLLLPRLPAAAGHLAPPLGVVRAGPTVGELSRHRLVEQWHADLDTEYVRFQLERAGLLALRVQHLYGRHRYFFSAIFCACCAFVAFTDFRSITRDPFAPGTAPRINTRFCSSITRTTAGLRTV